MPWFEKILKSPEDLLREYDSWYWEEAGAFDYPSNLIRPPEHEPLIRVWCKSRNIDPQPLIEIYRSPRPKGAELERLVRLIGSPAPTGRDAATEARDKYIYEECCRGTTYKAIIARIKTTPDWEKILGHTGIKAAAVRYAERHKLPKPPSRKSGRRPR